MTYIPEILRQQIVERANHCCEYSLIHEQDSLYAHEVDHIIPIKHRGTTHEANLCLACLDWNRSKGTDFSSFDPDTGQITPLYNPHQQAWVDHFRLDGVTIAPLTPEGRVTVFVLKLNDELRIRARRALKDAERYPPTIT